MAKMITPLVRFCYAHVFEASATPSGDMKFSVCIMIPKTDKKGLAAVNKKIQETVKKGVEIGKFAQEKVKSKQFRLPLRDGDEEVESGDKGPEYKGMMFMNASSKNRPGVVGPDLQPVMEQEDFYSGCWGLADINFFPYNTAGNVGIGVGLNNLMKKRDDERLDGRMKAEDAFADYAEEDPDGGVMGGSEEELE